MIREVYDHSGTLIAVWDGYPKAGEDVLRACIVVRNLLSEDIHNPKRTEVWSGDRVKWLAVTNLSGDCKLR